MLPCYESSESVKMYAKWEGALRIKDILHSIGKRALKCVFL
jgi:hypothetical protein